MTRPPFRHHNGSWDMECKESIRARMAKQMHWLLTWQWVTWCENHLVIIFILWDQNATLKTHTYMQKLCVWTPFFCRSSPSRQKWCASWTAKTSSTNWWTSQLGASCATRCAAKRGTPRLSRRNSSTRTTTAGWEVHLCCGSVFFPDRKSCDMNSGTMLKVWIHPWTFLPF